MLILDLYFKEGQVLRKGMVRGWCMLLKEMEAAVVCQTVHVSTETNYITTKSYSSWAKTSILMSKHSAKFFSPDFITSSLLKYWTGLLGWWVAEPVDSLTLHAYESLLLQNFLKRSTLHA